MLSRCVSELIYIFFKKTYLIEEYYIWLLQGSFRCFFSNMQGGQWASVTYTAQQVGKLPRKGTFVCISEGVSYLPFPYLWTDGQTNQANSNFQLMVKYAKKILDTVRCLITSNDNTPQHKPVRTHLFTSSLFIFNLTVSVCFHRAFSRMYIIPVPAIFMTIYDLILTPAFVLIIFVPLFFFIEVGVFFYSFVADLLKCL